MPIGTRGFGMPATAKFQGIYVTIHKTDFPERNIALKFNLISRLKT